MEWVLETLDVLYTSFSVAGTLNAVCEQGAVCCWVFIHKQYPWITRDEKTMMLSVYVCKPSIYIVLPYSYIKCLHDNLKPAHTFCMSFADILYIAIMRTNGKMKNKFSSYIFKVGLLSLNKVKKTKRNSKFTLFKDSTFFNYLYNLKSQTTYLDSSCISW